MEPDFQGWATKAGLKCLDGRTIMPDAFAHMDGKRVPLVWQHGHNSPENVLGHVILHAKPEGIRVDGFFNDQPQGINTKALVMHNDIDSLSIYANQLVEKSKQVFHGMIKEVSLCLAGANPGAKIDFVNIRHSDGDVEELEDEAIITTGEKLTVDSSAQHAVSDGTTAQEVWDSMNEDQQALASYMIAQALGGDAAAQSDTETGTTGTEDPAAEDKPENATEGESTPEGDDTKTEGDLAQQEGTTVTHNVFDQTDKDKGPEKHVLSHDAIQSIMGNAARRGSLKLAVEEYALAHGIDNIDVLFPEAKTLGTTPEFDKRRTEWVAGVLNGTRKIPFTRIKTISADITVEEARARGYVKGNLKKEEFFGVQKRTTGPSTVYKKQKLDRDDILDITDFDVVSWVKAEMRMQLDEEIARAVLIGDGREVDDADKVADPAGASSGNGIRSIVNDHELYVGTVNVNLDDSNSSYLEFIDEVIKTRSLWKGTGTPTMYTTQIHLSKMLLLRDTTGRRMFRTTADLAAELLVDSIVPVEVMETMPEIIGILVNLQDYTIGTDRGGEVTMFDQFDIDFNQEKYLTETRLSGALTKIRSALVYKTVTDGASVTLAVPVKPTFNSDTNVITIPSTTGVTYKRADTDGTVTGTITLNNTSLTSLEIYSVPSSGSYYIEDNVSTRWTFHYHS